MRYYYTDPVAAAYMTAHHKIRFKRNDDLRETYMEICGDLPLFQQASAEAA